MQHQIVQFGNRLTLNSAVSNRARLNTAISNSATSIALKFNAGALLIKKELLWQLNNMLFHNCAICCSINIKSKNNVPI